MSFRLNARITVLYSTVTGNSKLAALLLAQEAERKRYNVSLQDVQNYNVRCGRVFGPFERF